MSNPGSVGSDGNATDERAGPDGTLSRRRLLAAVGASAMAGGTVTGRSAADPPRVGRDVPSATEVEGVDVVQDRVWVETPVDTNDSGENDRVFVDATRPASADAGSQVPVIVNASPYYGERSHGDVTREMEYDRSVDPSATVDDAPGDGTPAGGLGDPAGGGRRTHGFGGRDAAAADVRAGRERADVARSDRAWLERRYLQQEYAVAQVMSLGKGLSTGCYTAAGPETAEALAAVVDWFNGRATAYDAETGGEPVTADWANGRVGMIGTSAPGELANAVASTGVDGLEAIVPQAANNGQYSMFRANGTPIAVSPDDDPGMVDLASWVAASNGPGPDCAHWAERVEDGQDYATGDFNDFWYDREFIADAESIDAAVLMTHAIDDPVVKPNHFADWYRTLDAHDVPVRLWVHEGGHTRPRSQAWADLLDRWWARWLRDEENGVMDEDPVWVTHDEPPMGDADYTYADWPAPDAEGTAVQFASGGATAGEVTLSDTPSTAESLVDDPSVSAEELVHAPESAHRLRYESPPLSEPVHVSGTVVPSLTVSFDDPTVVSVALYESTEFNNVVVTRGWADPLNRPSYGEYDSPLAYKESLRESSPVEPGEQVQVEFRLQATDYVFDAGNRIGLVVYASDNRFTIHPPGNAEVTVSLGESSVSLPVVGGREALAGAFSGDPPTEGTPTPTDTPDASNASGTTAQPPGNGERTDAAGPRSDDGSGETPTATDRSEAGRSPTAEDGPGFGVGGALAALGAAGYRLRRRLADDEADAE